MLGADLLDAGERGNAMKGVRTARRRSLLGTPRRYRVGFVSPRPSALPRGHRRACGPCHRAGWLGRPTRRAACRRSCCHPPDPRCWPPGTLGVGCSAGGRPTPPPAHAQARHRPTRLGVLDEQGQGDATEGPDQCAHDDQELAELAKRSARRASKVGRTNLCLPCRRPRRQTRQATH